MKRNLPLIGLTLIIFVGYLSPTIAAAVDLALALDNTPEMNIMLVGCHQVSAANWSNCRQMEEHILQSSVRLLIQTWIAKPDDSGYEFYFSEGHATVKDGRYLLTHNHFGIPLSIRPGAGTPGGYSNITLFSAEGERLIVSPLTDYRIVYEEAETLVLGHWEERFLEELGFRSAEFGAWQSLTLKAGMETAQIDWDGATTRVEWTVIQEVSVEDGVPRLVLANGTKVGASGGGVFWQGIHVANNWRLEERLDANGNVVGAVTTVALNSARVVDPDGQFSTESS